MPLRKLGKFQTENKTIWKCAKLDYHHPEYDSHYTKRGNTYCNRDWFYRRHSLYEWKKKSHVTNFTIM